MRALQESSREPNCRSIAFPAISAGIYGFPIEKCAICMVKAIFNFSQTPSDLINISVIIHTSKRADAKHFISALKQHLPLESIQVNDEQASMARVQKHSTSSKPESMSTSISKSANKKKKKKSAAVLKVPPGVLDCIKLVKGSLLNVTVSNLYAKCLLLYQIIFQLHNNIVVP